MKRFFDKFVQKMADSYSPSIGGAIGLGVIVVGGGALVAAPVAGIVGGLIAGGTGAAWGAGCVLGVASLWIARAVIPHYIQGKCHDYTRRGEDDDLMSSGWWGPGTENLRRNNLSDKKEMMGKAFSRESKKNPKTPNDKNPPKNTPNQPKP